MPLSQRIQQLAADAKSRIREVTAKAAAEQQKNGALLVDVREAEEIAKEHAQGAIHLSRGTVELKIEQHTPEMAAPIICYCGGGNRSALVLSPVNSRSARHRSETFDLLGFTHYWSHSRSGQRVIKRKTMS